MTAKLQAFFRPYQAHPDVPVSKPYKLMLQVDRFLTWSSQQNLVVKEDTIDALEDQTGLVDKKVALVVTNKVPFYKSAVKVMSFVALLASLYFFPQKRKYLLAAIGAIFLTKLIFRSYMTSDHEIRRLDQLDANTFQTDQNDYLLPYMPQTLDERFQAPKFIDTYSVELDQLENFLAKYLRFDGIDVTKVSDKADTFKMALQNEYEKIDKNEAKTLHFDQLEALLERFEKLIQKYNFNPKINVHSLFSPSISLTIYSIKDSEKTFDDSKLQNQNSALFKAIVAVRSKEYNIPIEPILTKLNQDLERLPAGNQILFIGLSELLRKERNMKDAQHNVLNQLGQLTDLPEQLRFENESRD